MYLQALDIRYCRCSFLDRCIYKALIFIVADALFGINVSATCFSLNLQILLILPVMYNCICILPFLGFKDTSFANFASTSHIFDNVKMLPSKITHPQLALSMLCGCSHQNFASSIPYRRYRRSISFEFYLLHNLSQYITYKKIGIRNSSEYGIWARILISIFVKNVLPFNELNRNWFLSLAITEAHMLNYLQSIFLYEF